MKKSPWKKLPCLEGLATLFGHEEVGASIGEWKETCFKCLLDCILLTKNFIQAMCSPTGVQHCLSCCGTMTVNVLNWKKVSSYEINSHQINFPWGQLPQNRLNTFFNIQIYQNTELIWWITHDKVNGRSAIICLFYTGFAGTEKWIMTARTQIEKVADAKQ